jgi:hypothetical protein
VPNDQKHQMAAAIASTNEKNQEANNFGGNGKNFQNPWNEQWKPKS